MKRGQRIKSVKYGEGTVLGPEDFEGYDYNDPGNLVRKGQWVLIKWDSGNTSQIADKGVEKI